MHVLVLLVSLVELLLLTVGVASAVKGPAHSTPCSRHNVRLRLKHRDCLPTRVFSRACSGTCSSYTEVSPTDPRRLETRCYCCQYMGQRRKRFGIKCPSKKVKGAFRILVMTITQPRACKCRPCAEVPDRIVAAEATLLGVRPLPFLDDMLRTNTYRRTLVREANTSSYSDLDPS